MVELERRIILYSSYIRNLQKQLIKNFKRNCCSIEVATVVLSSDKCKERFKME